MSVTLLQSIFTERTLCGFTLNRDPSVAEFPTQHWWGCRAQVYPSLIAASVHVQQLLWSWGAASCSSLVPQGPSLPVWDPHLHLQCFLQLAQKVSLSQAWGAFRFRRVNISLPEDPLTMELRELDAPLPWVTSAEEDTKWALQSKRPGSQPQALSGNQHVLQRHSTEKVESWQVLHSYGVDLSCQLLVYNWNDLILEKQHFYPRGKVYPNYVIGFWSK